MNAEDIDELEAGRDLDALIAEYLFGWVWVVDDATYMNVSGKRKPSRNLAEPEIFSDVSWRWDGKAELPIDNSRAWFPKYSTKIKHAWLVLERCHQLDIPFSEHSSLCDSTPWDWCALNAAEMAFHICKSALKASILIDCAACHKPSHLAELIEEYGWRFCFDCHHTLAQTDIQVRGRDRKGIFTQATISAQQEPPNQQLTELFHNSLTNRGKQVLAQRAIEDLEAQQSLEESECMVGGHPPGCQCHIRY